MVAAGVCRQLEPGGKSEAGAHRDGTSCVSGSARSGPLGGPAPAVARAGNVDREVDRVIDYTAAQLLDSLHPRQQGDGARSRAEEPARRVLEVPRVVRHARHPAAVAGPPTSKAVLRK